MKKVLSIVIPFKNESLETLSVALSSINNQIGVDWGQIEVHLINDGGLPLSLEPLRIFSNLDLHYSWIENVGPGLARQYGIDQSQGEYIMFMDGDDQLFYGTAFYDFFLLYQEQKYDLILGRFVEQYVDSQGTYCYKTHEIENRNAVYGKWYRRSYLQRIDLAFHPQLRIYEDMYFVNLAYTLTENIGRMNKVVYAWLHNPDSMMRSNGHASRKTLDVLVLQHRLFLEALRDKRPQKYRESVRSYLEKISLDFFVRYSLYGAADEERFWEAYHALAQEFHRFYPHWTPELQKQLEVKISSGSQEWRDLDTQGFKAFMDRSRR